MLTLALLYNDTPNVRVSVVSLHPPLPHPSLLTLTEAAGLTSVDARVQLKCLPLWMCLQSLGHEGMVNRVKASCDLAKSMFEELDKLTTIKQIVSLLHSF